MLAGLLLAALGVDDEVIVEDYVRSERALEPTLAWATIHAPEVAERILGMPGWLVHATPDHMWAFLDHLNLRYGSARAFLTAIGIDDAEVEGVRDRFLE